MIVVLDKGCIARKGRIRNSRPWRGLYYKLVKNQLGLGIRIERKLVEKRNKDIERGAEEAGGGDGKCRPDRLVGDNAVIPRVVTLLAVLFFQISGLLADMTLTGQTSRDTAVVTRAAGKIQELLRRGYPSGKVGIGWRS